MNKLLALLLIPISVSSIAADFKKAKSKDLVSSPEMIVECGIQKSHFYSTSAPYDKENCQFLSRKSYDDIMIYNPSVDINIGNNDTVWFEPIGILYKNRVKIRINNQEVKSPIKLDFIGSIFNSDPKIYDILKYPNEKNPTHYFLSLHLSTIIFDRKKNKFCPRYIPGDMVKFFQHNNNELIASEIYSDPSAHSEKIRASTVNLDKLCN